MAALHGMFKGIYNGKQYHAPDIQAVLTRAWRAGVDRIIVTGGSLEESREALAIAETDGRLFCTVGVHPTRCKEFEDSGDPERHFQALVSLAKEGVEKGKGIYNGKQYHAPDIQVVLTRAWRAGVDRIIVTGGSLEESREALAIAETDGRLFCTVGVHPTRCKEFEDSGDPERHFQALVSLAKEGVEKGKEGCGYR
ncbi:hypothetical protein Dimus_030057 [Dionaea muscipula]